MAGASYYGYGPGVNAANLTGQDIAKANARIKPQRQQSIWDGSLKGFRNDTKMSTACEPACGVIMSKYFSWTRKELSKAIVDNRIKSGKAVAKM